MIFVSPFGREGKGEHIPCCHRAAVEQRRAARSRQPVKKKWNLVVCLGQAGVPDNDPTKQTSVYIFADVHVVVVEWPRPNRFRCHVKDVSPRFPWADGVAAAAVMTQVMNAKRPGTIGIDSVDEPVHVEAVRLIVSIEDMDEEPLARFCIDHGARNTTVKGRLVDVRVDQLREIRNRISRVEIFPVDDGIEPAKRHFCVGDCSIFVTVVEHTVPAKGAFLRVVRGEGAVTRNSFDL